MAEPKKQHPAIAGLHAADESRDYILISHGVSRALHAKLSRLLAGRQLKDKATVFLTTLGGDPDGGYRLARCLRHHYKEIRVAVPSYCKSAGTLIALVADELAIGDLGELGPLDIQVNKGSELSESSSGLDIQQALQAVTSHAQDAFHKLLVGTRGLGLSTKLCAEFAATVTAGIVAPLMSQIDPLRVGEMQRLNSIALAYGQRLNAYSRNLKEGTLERLLGEYPTHNFVIDRREARELFNRVAPLTNEEKIFCEEYWPVVGSQTNIDPILLLDLLVAPQGTDDEQPNEELADPMPAEAEAGPVDNPAAQDGPHDAGEDPAKAA